MAYYTKLKLPNGKPITISNTSNAHCRSIVQETNMFIGSNLKGTWLVNNQGNLKSYVVTSYSKFIYVWRHNIWFTCPYEGNSQTTKRHMNQARPVSVNDMVCLDSEILRQVAYSEEMHSNLWSFFGRNNE
jgi:hypothetical protein